MHQGPRPRHVTRGLAWLAAAVALVVAMSAGAAVAQTSRVNGTVKDGKGKSIKGAVVVADGRQVGLRVSAVTDDRGRFVFAGLHPGIWLLRATAPGYNLVAQQLDVTAGRNRSIDFELENRPGGSPSAPSSGDIRAFQGELDAAATLLDAGQYDAAIRAYESILERSPALNLVHLQLGNAWRAKRDYDRALAEFGEVLKVDPANERARLGLGLSHLGKGDLPAAERALEAAAGAASPSRDVLIALGDVKLAQKQPDAAAAWFSKAAKVDPESPEPLLRLAKLAEARGNRAEAVSLLEKVVALAPDAPAATEAKALLEKLRK